MNARQLREKCSEGVWICGGYQKIQIMEGFLAPAIGAGDFYPARFGMLPEDVEKSFSIWCNFSKKVVSGKSLVVFDRAQDLLFGFCSEPRQGANLACFARPPQISEGTHLKLIV